MIRLHFVVEGQTEEAFVNEVLAPQLWTEVVSDVRTVGGISTYPHLKDDLGRWMREDKKSDARFTSMVDLYRLPKDFPGWANSRNIKDPFDRVLDLEQRLADEIDDRRFVPYIQLHEFEALLLSYPEAFALQFPRRTKDINKLTAQCASAPSPEHIDDGPATHPSKRILDIFPDYDKVSAGSIIAKEIGLDRMRKACCHFDDWVKRLEALR